nr:hypothetical protein [Tanacetum cinerariifolium]
QDLLQPPLDHTLQLEVGFLPLPSEQSTAMSEDKQHPFSLAWLCSS